VKKNIKKGVMAMILAGGVTTGHANDVCKILPGSVTCGKGTVSNITGNGMVNINGTTVSGAAVINGLLSATDANFLSLDVNGSANLIQCTINELSEIKGLLTASSTKFDHGLTVYSSSTRFINSKVNGDLHLPHSKSQKQIVYLDNFSEVTGDIVFDDGQGEVVVRGKSKIGGKVVGGQTSLQ